MRHPKTVELALYAGNDLGFWARRRVTRHIADCAGCRKEAHALREAVAEIYDLASEIPAGLNWGRLAAEMKANIRLGLAAGECVAPEAPNRHPFGFRQAMAMASVALLVLAGWFLNVPQPRSALPQAGAVVRQTAAGIAFEENGGALTMRVPSDAVMLTVSTQGSLAARYVDNETGQVTISNVYAQ